MLNKEMQKEQDNKIKNESIKAHASNTSFNLKQFKERMMNEIWYLLILYTITKIVKREIPTI